ncbi:MAG: thioredoxin-disulfide reductase [Candidatus Omnitrophica bacterium CG11_big_fil_rev_8_21_14_0_20_42_13]|uniref:Thioredoxin-disulfide reductase n=1 Tax=Candidatus Ghiorseimicrobium undicola TaxID=1974746 RepID=A0A2H0LZL6_9BACT|nr:MAG: thioredoxin-disulfide reductase [Candidatus Omnitrophica bacterium CG11_big_fil_rev_8_21_14_0_20_42_13]
MHDLIIIGAGPAGITASVYAARKGLKTMVISKDIGGQAALSGDVENYTGYQFISGPELADKFEEHMRRFNIEVKEPEAVLDVVKSSGGLIEIKTDKDTYKARAVIIATGARWRQLNVAGEKEYKNKGLTYCATCDGPLFSGKDVAIIGGGNSAMDAALQLINIAAKIYIINIAPKLTGDEIMIKKVESSDKVAVFNESAVTKITGDTFVRAIKIKHPGGEKTLQVSGVFVEIGLIPNSEIVNNAEKNSRGEIKLGNDNQTSIEGIFAAGDVSDVAEKQIIVAAGEGSKAALGVFKYLARQK